MFADALFRGWNVVDLAKTAVIILAIVAIVLIACRAFGVSIPAWVVQMLWVVLAAAGAIIAITVLASL